MLLARLSSQRAGSVASVSIKRHRTSINSSTRQSERVQLYAVMTNTARSEGDMLQGTLDMLILQTLLLGPAHGHSIAHAIERDSDEVLQVEHGSLYPALHRLEDKDFIKAFW